VRQNRVRNLWLLVLLLVASAAIFGAIYLFIPSFQYTIVYITVGVPVIYSAISLIFELTERLFSAREIMDRVRGYNREAIEEGREIVPITLDNYVSRPDIEMRLAKLLRPATGRVVLLWNESRTGKTTTVAALIRDELSERYNGQVAFVRAVLPVERLSQASSEYERRHLLATYLCEQVGRMTRCFVEDQTLERQRTELRAWLGRARRPWLLVFDKVERDFPFADVLPYLASGKTTILLIAREEDVSYLVKPALNHAPEIVAMPLLGQKEGEQLLRRRLNAVPANIMRELAPHFHETIPGFIVDVCDLLRSGHPISELIDMLQQARHIIATKHTAEHIIIADLTPEERRFLATFAVIEAWSMQMTVVHDIARWIAGKAADHLIDICVRRDFIKRNHDAYFITQFGRTIGRAVLREESGIVMYAGPALLDTYRDLLERYQHGKVSAREMQAEMTNILDALAWAEQPPRHLAREERVHFPAKIMHPLWLGGPWRAGTGWLTRGVDAAIIPTEAYIAARLNLTGARIAFASGMTERTLSFIENGERFLIASPPANNAVSLAPLQGECDGLRLWFARLHLLAAPLADIERDLSGLTSQCEALVKMEISKPGQTGEARELLALFYLDAARLSLAKGDVFWQDRRISDAVKAWDVALVSIASAEQTINHKGAYGEVRAQIARLRGMRCSRRALASVRLLRRMWRWRAAAQYRRSVAFADAVSAIYETALTTCELAHLYLLAPSWRRRSSRRRARQYMQMAQTLATRLDADPALNLTIELRMQHMARDTVFATEQTKIWLDHPVTYTPYSLYM
jgi:transcriptional regulator with XRE-family HTH domain